MLWYASSGRPILLSLAMENAEECSHQGQCDLDVEALMLDPEIEAQTSAWDPETLRAELAEYGAWDDKELADHEENVARMVWIACNDVAENPGDYCD